MMIRKVSFSLLLMLLSFQVFSQKKQLTYCNPINLDYGYTPIPNFSEQGRHRATADPVIVNYKGDYYLFSTNQWGYWWSNDLTDWKFVSKSFLRHEHKVYDDLCAPSVWIQGDTMLVFGSTYSRNFPIWMSTNPKGNDWKEVVANFDIGGWDPAHFVDDDGRLYMYNGSSNVYPLYGVELNAKTFDPIGTRKELLVLRPERYGWQRFGEHLDNTFLDPFMEGAWVTKHNKKYYLQYGAPATEFSNYADGVAIGTTPLGPFEHQSLPLSWKAGGFARGAGHGATFQDHWKNYWHVSTIALSVKNSFERRIGMWPTGFDKDDVMYTNTAFGDYPHYLPTEKTDHLKSRFTGWMLLNYNKPVQVSSSLGGYPANHAVDENIRTYWSAASGNSGEWIQTDLGMPSTVHAVQINYADQDAAFLGKQQGIYHQYQLMYSVDGKSWKMLADKSKNKTDVPHDYIEFDKPVKARYIKLTNLHMPTGKFAISGLRVFGNAGIPKPSAVKDFIILRTESDKRSAWLRWRTNNDAYAYNIYIGTSPDKLYNSIMIYGANEYWYKGMDKEKPYYFRIEALNENGHSTLSDIIKAE
ncbi:discoidin domain-containing protein [Pedobacter sp.]|uniref:discoidin domain-containing protein n=1 Tax=Pedobacter sp. TaxID=1411316 RepID=UPI003D7FF6DE